MGMVAPCKRNFRGLSTHSDLCATTSDIYLNRFLTIWCAGACWAPFRTLLVKRPKPKGRSNMSRALKVSFTGFEPIYVDVPEIEAREDAEAQCVDAEEGVKALLQKQLDIQKQHDIREWLKDQKPEMHGFGDADLTVAEEFAAWREALTAGAQELSDAWLFDHTPKPRGGKREPKKVDVSTYGDTSEMSADELIAKMREAGDIK